MARLLSDVDINLSLDGRGDVIVHTSNRDLVRNAVGVVMGVMLGEVPFLPHVGNSAYLQSFNFQTDVVEIQRVLQDEIESQVPGSLLTTVAAVPNNATRVLALNVGIRYVGEFDTIDVLSEGQLSRLAAAGG